MTKQYNLAELAQALGYHNVEALEYDRKKGLVLAPDGVFNKLPYWHHKTVQQMIEIRSDAIRSAWGYPLAKVVAEPDQPEGARNDFQY